MLNPGFHEEWITIADHRVLLECRNGFPDEMIRLVARVAVEVVTPSDDGPSFGVGGRVVRVFYDDKASVYSVEIATDEPQDPGYEESVLYALRSIWPQRLFTAQVFKFKPGSKESDHYIHSAYLSRKAGIGGRP